MSCLFYQFCIQGCLPGDDFCFNDCANQEPIGAQLYLDLAICIVCGACYADCDGAGSGCP